jgi:hypothetical protein
MSYRFKVYNPCWQSVDVAGDWGFSKNEWTNDLSLALEQKFKIAAVKAYYNRTWVASYDPAACHGNLQSFDLVLISDAEYYSQQQIEEWCAEIGITRYLIALGGYNETDKIDPARMIYRHYWIEQYTCRNKFEDTRDNAKPYIFDSLMGARRPNRDYVMMGLTKHELLDRSIVTYRDCFPGVIINQQTTEFANLFPDQELPWPYVSPNLDPEWEVTPVVNNQISFITPVEIYRRTYYSILTETLGTGGGFFFSEKSIKAFFAKRIFVLFGNQHHLKRLRDLGFQTFDSVIDESYDKNPLDFERFGSALKQAVTLSQLDPIQVQDQLQPVLDHNHDRLFELVAETKNAMHKMLLAHTPTKCWS